MFQLDRLKQNLLLDGTVYTKESIIQYIQDHHHKDNTTFKSTLFCFLKEWFDDSETVTAYTSGSTGAPKSIQVEKSRMMQSACLTCSFLGLKSNDTALLCMPLEYIGGKMLVVRALVLGLNLFIVPPSRRPFKGIDKIFTFAAMTPNQVAFTLEHEKERYYLQQVRHLIIGGSCIDSSLERKLSSFPYAVWSTYGMTETLSHIALRRINGSERSEWYRPFDGINVSLSWQGTLVIEAPSICSEPVITNDIAEINSQGYFRILGRQDNVVISGGVKIQIEQVEEVLQKYIQQPFAVTSVPHPQFGEQLVLLIKGHLVNNVEHCKEELPIYWYPKQIIEVEEIPQTGTGKIDRALAKNIASAHCLK